MLLIVFLFLLTHIGIILSQIVATNPISDVIIGEQNIYSNFSLFIPRTTFSCNSTYVLSSDAPDWITPSLHISDPFNFFTSEGSGSLFVDESEKVAYICDSVLGLQIIDIEDPSSPQLMKSIELGGNHFSDIVVVNDTVFLTETGEGVVFSVNVYDLEEIIIYEYNDMTYPSRLAVDYNRGLIFVTEPTGLTILEKIEDIYLRKIAVYYEWSPTDIELNVEDEIMFLASGEPSLIIFDIRTEYVNDPVQRSQFQTESRIYSLLFSNQGEGKKRLYLSTEEKLLIYSVDDPSAPSFLGDLAWPSSSLIENSELLMFGRTDLYGGLFLKGTNYIFAYGSFLSGVVIVDVSGDSAVIFSEINLDHNNNNMTVNGLHVIDNNQFYISNTSGLYVHEFGDLLLKQTSPVFCGFHGYVTIYGHDMFGNDAGTYFSINIHLCECFGVFGNDSEACMLFGECIYNNTCSCDVNYYGVKCDISSCFSILSNDSVNFACSNGSGDCVGYNQCDCKWYPSDGLILPIGERIYEFYGDECEFTTTCYDKTIFQTDEVCSGHGICHIDGRCSCLEDYEGDACEIWHCFNYTNEEVGVVCGGHGFCLEAELCVCESGYYPTFNLGPCVLYFCGEYEYDDVGACNTRGTCESSGKCDCVDGYEGDLCETWSCGYPEDHHLTCRGMGKCLSPDVCDCDTGYTGAHCGFMTAGAISAIVVPSVLVCGCLICCLFCYVCICSCFAVIFCIGFCMGLFVYIFKQAKSLQRYSKLRNIDILLTEQKLEEDTSVFSLKIRKDLYKINFDELVIEKLLGEGGSQGLVFKCDWKGKTVAMKCFKTRLVCSSQNKFDDFEIEVQVLSSLKHPFVIQFFGATLKPPRVGIVMEYCEKGDLAVFLQNYKTYNLKEYPMVEKIRMLHEIALAMGYIHKKNIVHRDLKLENVLVTENEETRLMDFGLSKIVERMSQVRTTKIGTHIYMAPEVINATSSGYNQKVDVYSYSILCFIVMTEEYHPYGEKELMVELKVASNPDYRPDISLIEKKISETSSSSSENSINTHYLEWMKDLIVRNWDASFKNRNSFPEISEIFEKNRGSLLFDGSENKGGILEEKDQNTPILGDLKTLEVDFNGDEKNFYFYLKNEVERMRNVVTELNRKRLDFF